MGFQILVVDDEEGIRFSLRGVLEDEGHEVLEADSAEAALDLLERVSPDLIFLDIWLPGLDGLAALEAIRLRREDCPVVVISGHGTIETAVTAIKKGAFDFIEKPLSLEKVIIACDKALEYRRLREENHSLRLRLKGEPVVRLTGSSPVMEALRRQISQVAPTDAWVLITGESGAGKELVARAIHQQSRRQDRPLIAVNCAAIPEELIESELFGHEKGSFTGADRAQPGKFELAHRGTLFLDEIGDMSLKTQAKILRILQEQSFERVGGRKPIRVDVRVMAATNKNLPEEIRAGRFREDLYYRLRVFPLEAPPLRARVRDIGELLEEFSNRLVREQGFRPLAFDVEAMRLLELYPWPGNVRELKNFVERMFILHAGETVEPEDLPAEILTAGPRQEPAADGSSDAKGAPSPAVGSPETGPTDFKTARALFEARFLEARLREHGGNISRLAEAIGLERSYLHRKLKSYGIQIAE